jgi:hypothetical protein
MRKAGAADKLGDFLAQVTPAQIADALARQQAGDARPLGMLLIELGYATPTEIEFALMRQRARRGHLDHADGVRLLEEAEESTKRAASSMEELTQAAEELMGKTK